MKKSGHEADSPICSTEVKKGLEPYLPSPCALMECTVITTLSL